MKALVVSLDKAIRMNSVASECIEAFRPSVVTVTQFVKGLQMNKLIDCIETDLPMTATDEQFATFLRESKGDTDLAVKSFLAAVKGNPTGNLDDDKAAEAAATAAAAPAAAADTKKAK